MEDWEFPVVQWLELCASNAGGTDSVPGWGTKILQATQCGQKKKVLQILHAIPNIWGVFQ